METKTKTFVANTLSDARTVASAKAKGITVEALGGYGQDFVVAISGETFMHKSTIKDAGFRWNARANRWELRNRPEAMNTAIDTLRKCLTVYPRA